MWSLGKVMATPEVKRVYISSFWDKPFVHDENKVLFEKEREDLYQQLRDMPKNAAIRKVNKSFASHSRHCVMFAVFRSATSSSERAMCGCTPSSSGT